MVKKLLITSVFVLFAITTYGQTIVSTSPENKNVVLEEFTGIYCVFCPDGHSIAQGIQNANPDRVSLINIHQGGFASPSGDDPDFRTPFGNALAAQTGLTGYPSGTVNRHVFSGSNTILGRNQWPARANEIMAVASYVNLAATAAIDVQTNIMNIHVEAYYTGDSPESTNFLNVVLLQDNTKGPQTGGGQGNNYNHMHRLVDMVTGQWGEEINQTTSGTFVERDFAYPILNENNNIPVEIGDLEIVVFMTETRQEIISGNRTTPTTNVTYTNDANVRYVEKFSPDCAGEDFEFTPKVNIQNVGTNPITSLSIEYTLNGVSDTFAWTGNIESLKSETITLPEVSTVLLETNTFEVSIPNDDYNANNVLTIPFEVPLTTGTLDLIIETDNRGDQCRWNLKDSQGTTVANGGPYGNNEIYFERINIAEDCYTFSLIDTGGDGGNTVSLIDNEGTEIFVTDGTYGTIAVTKFYSDGVLGLNQTTLENVTIYPNPAKDEINISNAENAEIKIYDVLGKMIFSMNNIEMNQQLNVAKFETGTYFIKISKDNSVTTKRFLISR
ncbi:Omp28-related outer membrane protein [Aequorivita sp. F47161]|uniref:Omp28-related outer membrane protein n=1 Tax=Aequorivita vitellina TaxID=2874475 RepID=A0A9X1QW38_9FLAO|nr:T9SS type A sorting domain-containing protein [Aequorivita vitellina]MCG2418198.1 Omp28-related outer membrane protein [Aequorivita vitellina]